MEPERISTWGEIAQFLKVDVKTAQRWEKERGLPVRRLPGGRRGQVHAYRVELERWLAGGEDAPRSEPAVAAPRGNGRPTRRKLMGGIAGGAGLAVAAWFGAGVLRRFPRIVSGRMEGHALVAQDHHGRELWRFACGGDSPRLGGGDYGRPHHIRTVDFRADGHPDLVAGVRRDRGVDLDETLYSFDPKGRIRWSWKPTLPLLDFDGKPFEPVWEIQSMLVTNGGGKGSLWVSVANPLRWASALLRMNPDGRPAVHFANAGWIIDVVSLNGPELELVAMGINNAFDSPFLALIGEQDPPSLSPAGGPPRFRYSNGPAGHVRKYVLFPESEFVPGGFSNYLMPQYLRNAGGGCAVNLRVNREPGEVLMYAFDRRLRPVKVRPAYGFNVIHQALHREGLLNHELEDCPELNKPHVFRCWTPGGGWTEEAAPVAHRDNLL
jgi:hypothetical protein